MAVESHQVKLQLTTNKAVLTQLRKAKAIRKNDAGKLVYTVQYDAQEFHFIEGVPIIVGKNMSENMQRNSWIIAGDEKIDAPVVPALDKIAETRMGEPWPGESRNGCNYCKFTGKNAKELVAHMISAHSGGKDTEPAESDADAEPEEGGDAEPQE